MTTKPVKSRLRRLLDGWEGGVDRFARSPWSSLATAVYGVVWIAAEAMRGKWIGWDGFATLVAIEVALSVRRWQRRNDPG